MEEIFSRIKGDKEMIMSTLDIIATPLYKDPLLILSHLQNSSICPPLPPKEERPTITEEEKNSSKDDGGEADA